MGVLRWKLSCLQPITIKNLYRILAFILPHLQEFYGYLTDEEATEKLGKPIIEPERQTVTFCDQTFDDIHIFSFDYQGAGI